MAITQDSKSLERFPSLTGYYRKFVRRYGGIVAPINPLLKKGEFTWAKEAKRSFEELKQKLIQPSIKYARFYKKLHHRM